jgi:hypothetical protein
MNSTMIKKMALPNPDPTNWTLLGVVWATVLGIISVLFKWIDSSFKARREEREAFITAVVDKAMSNSMKDIKDDISTLFQYREADRIHIDEKFSKMMIELKK